MKRSWIKRGKKDNTAKNARRKKLEEEYGVKLSYWRYEGRKGVYWSLLSEYIRRRDFYKYGTCVTTGTKFNTWKDSQAGHYAPAGDCGFNLLFDKRNIHGESAKSNNPFFSPGKLIPYRAELVRRYGEKWVKQLDADYKARHFKKEWSQGEYHIEILKLQEELAELIAKNENTN
jgi:hypothetical protein